MLLGRNVEKYAYILTGNVNKSQSYTLIGNIKECHSYGNQYGSSSKRRKNNERN
jgi:hypothetical protein